VGYAYGCSSNSQLVTVLIGDIATLHDVTGIAIAAGKSPGNVGPLSVLGGGRVGKIVCVNNSGGAIFSFLPAAKHRDDFFTPFLDTPHSLDISAIATALTGDLSIPNSKSSNLQCIRVTSADELKRALNDPNIFFIECHNLPCHQDNFELHKNMTVRLINKIENSLVEYCKDRMKWTHHKGSYNNEEPLVVMLHGWLGSEGDWTGIIEGLKAGYNDGNLQSDAKVIPSFLTVQSTHILSSSLFARTLQTIVRTDLKYKNRIVLIGYSQGARLAMHYRSLFPGDVLALTTLSGAPTGAPGRVPVRGFEESIFKIWKNCNDHHDENLDNHDDHENGGGDNDNDDNVNDINKIRLEMYTTDITQSYLKKSESVKTKCINNREKNENKLGKFLNNWYNLGVFSDIKDRKPDRYKKMIERRISENICISSALRDMLGGGTTNDATVDLMIVGALDLKYVALGNKGIKNNKILDLFCISQCGHIILSEVENEVVVGPIREFLRPLLLGTVHPAAPLTSIPNITSNPLNPSLTKISFKNQYSTAKINKISMIPFEISMETPLIVLSNGINRSFHTRKGYRIFLHLQGDNEEYVGLGEVYEPVFSVPLTDKGTHIGGEVTFEIMHSELTAIAVHLEGMTISISRSDPSADIVQTVRLIRASSTASPPVFYGFEQCLLHALSKLGGISLVDAIGAYIGKSKRSSHVLINGFATIRDNSKPITLSSDGAKQVMKMKVGNPGGSLCIKDALRVNELVLQSGRNDSNWLRLDANQSWSIPQALDFAKALDPASLRAMEYIEEPLIIDTLSEMRYMMYRDMKYGNRDSNWRFISIALDETLIQLEEGDCLAVAREISRNTDKEVDQEESKSLFPCRYILKPSLLGLNSDFYRQQEGLVTLSCTFEGGIGLAFLVLIGSYYSDVYHGIHAKMDMVHSDPITRDFTLLSIGKNGMEIQVIEAEKLLNDFISKVSAEV
jgi:hypothetical protein